MDDLATFIAAVQGPPSPWPLLELVPHDKPMSLLDEVVAVADDQLLARVHLHADSVFMEADGVPALVGIEYMAQAVAAFAGHQALQRNRPVRLGFLVGTRRYSSNAAFFTRGATLWVRVKELVQGENGLGVFECCVRTDDIYVSANLNVFQPENPAQFLAQSE
jgi:predicted hotdog family 3-hydroxylacyl-ACP dehydratase